MLGLSYASLALANPGVYEHSSDPAIGLNLIAWSGTSASNWTSAID